jgi:DNA-directed RNA polymerase subunit alpha
LTIESGKGFVPATVQQRSKTIGTIPVDALFSPVVRVNYFVEPTRVGQQTELDRLVLEITTDGSLQPSVALSQAAGILTTYLQLFRVEGADDSVEFEDGQAPALHAREIRIDDLDFSNRTYNCLKRQGIETLEELRNHAEPELMNIRNFGQKSLDEVHAKLAEYKMKLREAPAEPEELAV